MRITAFCVIVENDCPQHGKETLVLGPFTSQQEAESFAITGAAITGTPIEQTKVAPLDLNIRDLLKMLTRGPAPSIEIDGPKM